MSNTNLLSQLLAASAQFVDKNGLLYFKQKLDAIFATKKEVATKVDKVDGKQLSTNDYTNEEKTKLAGLQNYKLPVATADTLGGVKVGTGLAINEGVLSATGGGTADAVEWDNVLNKPTKVSQFANDAGYQNASQVNSAITSKGYQTSEQVEQAITSKDYVTNTVLTGKGYQNSEQVEQTIASKGYQTSAQVDSAITAKGYQNVTQVNSLIDSKIAGITSIKYVFVNALSELPETGEVGTLYFVKKEETEPLAATEQNIYTQYIWDSTNSTYEQLGNETSVDLTGYWSNTNLTPVSNEDINAMFA